MRFGFGVRVEASLGRQAGFAALALLAAACGGEEFQSSSAGGSSAGGSAGSASSGGSGAGGDAAGGSSAGTSAAGTAGTTGGGAGTNSAGGTAGSGPTDRCPGPSNLEVGTPPIFYTTLDDSVSLSMPVVGTGEGSAISTDPENDFVVSECEAGLRINADGEHFMLSETVDQVQNIDYRRGSLSFFFVSGFDSADHKRHVFFSTVNESGPSGFLFEKTTENELRFVVTPSSGSSFPARVAAGSFAFTPGKRVHFMLSWDFGLGNAIAPIKLYLDGSRLAILGTPLGLTMRGSDPNAKLRFGSLKDQGTFADGVFDDLRIYDVAIDK